MPVRLKTSEFKKAVMSCSAGLGSDNMLEQSSNFIIRGDKITSYDNEISITHPLSEDTGINAAVKGIKLVNLMKKTDPQKTPELMSISQKGNDLKMRFRNKAQASIRVTDEIVLPLDEIEEPGEWTELPAAFRHSLKTTILTASPNSHTFAFTCIHVGASHVESCDNLQALRFAHDVEMPELMVPVHIAKVLQGFLEGTESQAASMGLTENWAHFHNPVNGAVLSFRRVEEYWPVDLDNMLEFEVKYSFNLPESISGALDRARTFSGGELNQDEVVSISGADDGTLSITGEDGVNWYSEHLEKCEEKPPSFMINPEFLKQICSLGGNIEVGDKLMRIQGGDFVYAALLTTEE